MTLNDIERDLGRRLMTQAALGTLKAGDGGRMIADAQKLAALSARGEARGLLIKELEQAWRDLRLADAMVGHDEGRAARWQDKARAALAKVDRLAKAAGVWPENLEVV
jgi:hypothetical protein